MLFRSKVQIAAGGGFYFDQANYHTFENAGRFFSPLEEEFRAAVRSNRLDLGTTTSGYSYVQALWQATRRFSITPGVRLDHYGLTGETLLSPRIAAKLIIAPRLSATFAAGVYPKTYFLGSWVSETPVVSEHPLVVLGLVVYIWAILSF